MSKALGVIPARLASVRFSEKVLRPIDGRPMIQHVWERAKRAKKLDDVIIACDHSKIEECVKKFGGKVIMTNVDHSNGTSRISEIAEKFDHDILINVQGDQPLLDPNAVDEMISLLARHDDLDVVTLATRMNDSGAYQNPNTVKVVCDEKGNALYFSRSPIPFFRDGINASFSFLKHLGVYGYKKDFLINFIQWSEGKLEKIEKLEQLRILEKGHKIQVVETDYDFISVDTPEDLREVEIRLKEHSLRK